MADSEEPNYSDAPGVWLAKYAAQRQNLANNIEAVVADVKSRIKSPIDLPKLIGRLMDEYESCRAPNENRISSTSLYETNMGIREQSVMWSVEDYLTRRILRLKPLINELHKMLVKHRLTAKRPYEFNDMDNYAYHIKFPKKKIFVLKSQSSRYLFIIDGDDIHIREIWETYKPSKDEWEVEEANEFKEQGIKLAIKKARDLAERYSDNILKNQYVDRPDIAFYKRAKFEPEYGDCRDPGYVISYKSLFEKVDRGLLSFYKVENAVFHMLCTLENMRRDYGSTSKKS